MDKIRESQELIYRSLYEKFKGTPMAVSSESMEHKELRYNELSKLFIDDDNFSIHDVGMGLGAFYQHLLSSYPQKVFSYSGSEILLEFVNECKILYPELTFFHRDLSKISVEEKYDYLVMSGVFHQRRNTKISEWERFSQELIKNCFSMVNKGIAFNFISPFVDFYQTDVYYCNLPKLLNFINDELSRFFTIQHNYALFEFTVFIYKEDYIKSKFNQTEFQKYFNK